jgi:hypothetical protein
MVQTMLREFRAEGLNSFALLSGTIPNSIANWTAIETFSVSANALTGTLPAMSIGQWSLLRKFNNPGLTGTIPVSMANWNAIETINVYSTGLSNCCRGMRLVLAQSNWQSTAAKLSLTCYRAHQKLSFYSTLQWLAAMCRPRNCWNHPTTLNPTIDPPFWVRPVVGQVELPHQHTLPNRVWKRTSK